MTKEPNDPGHQLEQDLRELGALYREWGDYLQQGADLLEKMRIKGQRLRESLGGVTVQEYVFREHSFLFESKTRIEKKQAVKEETGGPTGSVET